VATCVVYTGHGILIKYFEDSCSLAVDGETMNIVKNW
jgi:hypothetical protein